jgi:hypothetical protein
MENISEEMHDNCDAIIVHPTGQLQIVKECWCKIYHVFGPNILSEETVTIGLIEDIQLIYLQNGQKYNQQPNSFLTNKLKKQIFGPGILFRKVSDLTLEKAKSLLV